MPTNDGVVIVGASVAGVATADALRRNGYAGRIRLVDAEPGVPHDKPPLSKQALETGHDDARLALRPDDHYRSGDIEVVLGHRAVGLDGTAVELDDGRVLAADDVVLAPGARARRLRGADEKAGVHVIRSMADALALRVALDGNPRVVVAGFGFIGAEVAASVRKRGLAVTAVELAEKPFAALIGDASAAAVTSLHRQNGVELQVGRRVDDVLGDDRVTGIRLDDGQQVDADVVVLGLGVVPNVEWLAGSGVTVTDGIVCDAHGRTDRPGVWAAGDAAAWPDAVDGTPRRIEHWTTAQQQGTAVGHNIAVRDDLALAPPVPYFWSDQYGLRIQSLGRLDDADEIRCVHGDWDPRGFVALYRRGDRLAGVLGIASARRVMPWRPRLEAHVSWDEALALAEPAVGAGA